LLWRQIRNCVARGVLPREALTHVRIQSDAPSLTTRDADKEAATNRTYVDLGVKSRATVAGELGLDWDVERRQLAAERETAAAPTQEDTKVGIDSRNRPWKTEDGVRVEVSPAEAKAIKRNATTDITKPTTGAAPSASEVLRGTIQARLSAWLDSHDGPPPRESRLDMFDAIADAETLESLSNHDGGPSGKAMRDLLMEALGAAMFGARLTGGSDSPSDIDVGHVYESLPGRPRLDIDVKRYLWDASGRARGHHGPKDLLDKIVNLGDDCYCQLAVIPPGRGKPGRIVARFGIRSLSATNGVVLADGFSSIRDVLADPARYDDFMRRFAEFRDSLTPERWEHVQEEMGSVKADMADQLVKSMNVKARAEHAAKVTAELDAAGQAKVAVKALAATLGITEDAAAKIIADQRKAAGKKS